MGSVPITRQPTQAGAGTPLPAAALPEGGGADCVPRAPDSTAGVESAGALIWERAPCAAVRSGC